MLNLYNYIPLGSHFTAAIIRVLKMRSKCDFFISNWLIWLDQQIFYMTVTIIFYRWSKHSFKHFLTHFVNKCLSFCMKSVWLKDFENIPSKGPIKLLQIDIHCLCSCTWKNCMLDYTHTRHTYTAHTRITHTLRHEKITFIWNSKK